MTGQDQYDLTTELLGGETISETVFLTLLNAARSRRENARPWRKLIKEDASKSASSSDVFTTMKDLPTDFRRLVPREPLRLTSGSTVLKYYPVRFEERYDHQNDGSKFYLDSRNSQFALCGSVGATYTIRLPYISASPEITLGTSWIFPDEFHPVLSFDVAAMHQLGADYDDVNARQGNQNAIIADQLFASMSMWDAELQRAELGI